MDIKVDQVGKIVKGENTGSYIKIINDALNTGGFLILTSTQLDMSDGFDNWVADEETLSQYFRESGWIVKWL